MTIPQTIQTCEDLLTAMVSFDTVNANISGVADAELELSKYLEALAGTFKFSSRRFPVSGDGFNLLVTFEAVSGGPWLLFESHLDTVTVDGMSIDPFAGRIDGGRIFGRGACDTKGSGAAMLWALKRYAQQMSGPNNIGIVFTLDEEFRKTGIKSFVRNDLPRLGWMPAGAVIGEPTQLEAVVAHTGAMRWTIHTRGVAAHSSNPSRGRSAISMMVRVIDALESRYIPNLTASHPLTGKAQCSINLIQGGAQINVIADHCQIRVDRRLMPGEDGERVLPAVQTVLDELCRDQPDLVVEQGESHFDPPLALSEDNPFVPVVQRGLRELNLPTDLRGAAYGTDASILSAAGVPAVVLGPGDITQAHTHDEWLELEQLNKAVEVYLKLMSGELRC